MGKYALPALLFLASLALLVAVAAAQEFSDVYYPNTTGYLWQIPVFSDNITLNNYGVNKYLLFYIDWHDASSGVHACFPYRPCTVEFGVVASSNVTVYYDGSSWVFQSGNGVAEGSVTVERDAWDGIPLRFVPDGNETEAFNYTLPLYTNTSLEGLSWSYSVALKTLTVTGKVVFSGYGFPAQGETVELLVNGTVEDSVTTGSDGSFALKTTLAGKGTYEVCAKAVHGNEECRIYKITAEGITVTVPAGLPSANYTFPALPTNLSATVPQPTSPGGIFVLTAFLALYILSAEKLGWIVGLFPLGVAMAGYGLASGSDEMVTGGIILLAGAYLLLKLRGG